jgi:small subunit ribosomal protein S13
MKLSVQVRLSPFFNNMLTLARTKIKHKYLFYALKQIYGIGKGRSKLLCRVLGFHSTLQQTGKVPPSCQYDFEEILEEVGFVLGSDLVYRTKGDWSHHVGLNSYKGNRHRLGLPVRGQRNHTNSMTQRRLANSRRDLKF